jgi:hypothetical protein
MKSLRSIALLVAFLTWLASFALAQSPTITSIGVKDTGCYYKVGASTKLCNIAPGMTLNVNGTNFGPPGGSIILCGCPTATIVKWSSTRVTAIVNAAVPASTISLETLGGAFSNSLPYNALAPVITSIAVGNCTYIPNQSPTLCQITPGTQFTINGSYFGPETIYSQVRTCDSCGVATINSWNPDWLTKPSPYNNQIVATANVAFCGSTVVILVNSMLSSYIPYTAC